MSTRPSPYAGSGTFLPNFNGEPPTNMATSRVPPDTAWQEEFLRDRPHCYPTLVAYRGFIPFDPAQRHYYLSADGWRDTETDAAWVIVVLTEDVKRSGEALDATLAELATNNINEAA